MYIKLPRSNKSNNKSLLAPAQLIAATVLSVYQPLALAETKSSFPRLFNLGLSVSTEQSFFAGGDNNIRIRPVRLNQDGYYIEGLTKSFFNGPNYTLYFGVGLDEWDDDRGDSRKLRDMDDLDLAVNVRLGGAWKTPSSVISADLAQDVASAHEGFQARLRYTHLLFEDAIFRPYGELQWFSDDITDYYTGVNANEVTPTRPAYEADADFGVRAGFNLNYELSPRFELVTDLFVTGYGDEITDSPITDRSSVWGASVGLVYK